MGEIINSARLKYEFLNENMEIKTNEVKTYMDNKIKIDNNFYIPYFLPRIFNINYIDLLILNIKYKNSCHVKIDYAINCNFKNEFFINQSYVISFSKDLIFNNTFDIKNVKLNILKYNLITDRFIKIYLIFDF